jgi:hypothetical protein
MTDWIRAQHETDLGPKYRRYRVTWLERLLGGVRLEPDDVIITTGEYAGRFFKRGLFYDWNWEYRAVDDPWVKKVGLTDV